MTDEVQETPTDEVVEPSEEATELSPSELSDEDLVKLLQDESAEEVEKDEEEEEDSAEEEKQEAKEPESKEAKVEPPKKEDDSERLKKLEEENHKLTSKLAQQEAFIQRRNTELGNTRAKLVEAIDLLKGRVDEKYAESPSEGMKLQKQIETLEGKVEAIDEETENLNNLHQTQVAVSKYIKPGECTVEGMAKCLAEDGIDPAYVEQFKKNPFTLGAAATVQLAKRSRAESERDEARAVAMHYYKLYTEAAKKPEKIVKQISTVAKQKPAINGGSGKSPAKKASAINPALLSDEELSELLKQATD